MLPQNAVLDAIAAAITVATGSSYVISRLQAIAGGCINQCFCLHGTDGRQFFLKLNALDQAESFLQEAAGLAELARADAIRVPVAVTVGSAADTAYLVLEYLQLCGQPDPQRFGTQLATLHRCSAPQFGFAQTTSLGGTPQPNAWQDDWCSFWSEQRLGYQLRRAREHGLPDRLASASEYVIAALPRLLRDHRPAPSLLHGDLWAGNWSSDTDGNPVLFDPAVYYGDRETDLAMMELFGAPDPAFFAAYDAAWPREPGHARRRDLYQLYHVLNHWNLFGGGYAQQAEQLAYRLLDQ